MKINVIFSGLLDLANAYCEEALKRDCERIIRHGITTENAAMLYAVAIKYEATVSSRRIEGMLTESLLASLFDRPMESIHFWILLRLRCHAFDHM